MLTKILDYCGFKKIDDWEDEIERLQYQIDSLYASDEMWKYRYERTVDQRDYWRREYEYSMKPLYREIALRGPGPMYVTIKGEEDE